MIFELDDSSNVTRKGGSGFESEASVALTK